jgi:hypothetical protein
VHVCFPCMFAFIYMFISMYCLIELLDAFDSPENNVLHVFSCFTSMLRLSEFFLFFCKVVFISQVW